MIGKLLDYRYQIVKVLATGGFGENYIARDTKRPGNPICVVKHLKPTSTESKVFDTAKRLFQSEAETLEKLGNHDQIPRLLAYFVDNQDFYLVQEYIEGHPLTEELVPGERWNEHQVVQMLLSVLSILEFVHSHGVIHRDIKPDNIIIRDVDNLPVLIDFGAVKETMQTIVSESGNTPKSSIVIGTPGFMSSEQLSGRPVFNSDLYALGMTAIYLLTGKMPQEFDSDPRTGEVVWKEHAPDVSPELATVLDKAIQSHVRDRFSGANEMLNALQSETIATTVLAPPLP